MAAVPAIPAELLILVPPGFRCWRSLAVESLFKGEREVDLSVIPHRGEGFTGLGLAPPPVACAISLLLSEAEPSASTQLDRHRLVLIRALQQFGPGPRGSDAPPFTKVLDTTRQSPEPLPGFHARRRGQKADDRQLCGSLPVTRTSA